MAVGKFRMYNQGIDYTFGATGTAWNLDTGGDTIVCVLCTNTYVPADTHTTFGTTGTGFPGGNEVTGGNYQRKVLASQSMEMGTGANDGTVYWKANKINWGNPTTNTTITAKYAVFVRKTGTGTGLVSGDTLLGYQDLDTAGTGTSSTNGKFELRHNSVDGVGTLFTAAGLQTD
jgi:hypothetical protein